MLRRVPAFVAAVFLTAAVFPGPARAQTRVPGVPAPMSFETEGVAACLVVGNFDTLLEHVEGIGRSFSPEIKPGMLKEQLGMMLGDPGLKSVEAKKPIVLWVLEPKDPGQIPPVALHLPVKDQSPLEAALQGMGLQVKAAEGILRASHTPEGLAAADKLLSAYQRVEKSSPTADARLYVRVSRLLKTYAPMIEGLAGMWAAQVSAFTPPPPPGDDPGQPKLDLGAILKLEVKALLGMLSQIREMQCDLTLSPAAIGSETTLAAEPGSALEVLSATPASVPPPASFILSEKGPMAASFQFDPRPFESAAKKFLEDLSKVPEISPWLKPEVTGMIMDFVRQASGSAAYDMQPSPKAGLGFNMAVGVKDEKAYLELVEKALGLYAPDGPLGKLSASLGMQLTVGIEKNAREHAGVKVHRAKMRPANPGAPQGPQDAWKAMVGDMEFALVKGYALISREPATLDRMIDRATAGAPAGTGTGAATGGPELNSLKTFGPGRLGYLDYDFIGLLKAFAPLMPQNPGVAAFANAKPGEPIAIALTAGEGRSLVQLKFPLDSIRELKRSFEPGSSPPPPAQQKKDSEKDTGKKDSDRKDPEKKDPAKKPEKPEGKNR